MLTRNLVRGLTNADIAELLETIGQTHELDTKMIAREARSRYVSKFPVLNEEEEQLAKENKYECVKRYAERNKVVAFIANQVVSFWMDENNIRSHNPAGNKKAGE
jgi:hypothetical protein